MCSTCVRAHLRIHALFPNLDGTIDSQHRDGEDGTDMSAAAPLADNVVLYAFSDIIVEPHSI